MGADSEATGSDRLEILAPAKLNLGLRILDVREDGYHCLESIFVPVDWADEVRVELLAGDAREIDFELAWAPDAVGRASVQVPDGSENLAYRAARGFFELAGRPLSVRVRLTKRLPSAAGLGGGSSDAGAVLRALARLRPDWVSPEAQSRLAVSLGADVPFFLDPRPAFVTGIGEKVDTLDDFPELHLLLANPGEPLRTADVFAAWDALSPSLTPVPPGSTLRSLSAFLAPQAERAEFDWAQLTDLLVNDLSGVAEQLCPPMAQLMSKVSECGARGVGMSGSGATIFGIFDSQEQARSVQEQLALGERGWSRLAATLAPR